MKHSSLFFATSNSYKFQEFYRLFRRFNITLEHIDIEVSEIQTFDIETIIKDKVIKAYSALSRPVLVDHSGLAMTALNGLPQGLNKQFWNVLKDKVCDLAVRSGEDSAKIIVYLGFCDGQRVHWRDQWDPGRVAPRPAETGTFHLDRVFIPEGSAITLAEMTETERDRISYRCKASEKAVAMLKEIGFAKHLGLR